MPERPTKGWWDACVAGVSSKGRAIDPKAVCGATWYRKPLEEREAIARTEHRHSGDYRRSTSVNKPLTAKEQKLVAQMQQFDQFLAQDPGMQQKRTAVVRQLGSAPYDERAARLWLRWVDDGIKAFDRATGVKLPSSARGIARFVIAIEYTRAGHGTG